MSDSKVFMFPEGASRGSVDPALLMSLANNGGMGGAGWMWVIFLMFLWPLMENGGLWGNRNNQATNGTDFLANMYNNDSGRELIMQAVNGNNTAIQQLSQMFGCKTDSIQQAINAATTQIQSVGNQVGLSGSQVINAIQAGNAQLANQLAQTCSQAALSNCQQTNTITNAINNTGNSLNNAISGVARELEQGFSQTGYATQQQTCQIQDSISKLNNNISQQFCNLKESAMQDKIDSLMEKNSTLATQINLEHQNQYTSQLIGQSLIPVNQALTALNGQVNSIISKMPETATIAYSPFTAVPNCVAYNMGLYGNGYACGNNGFWY